MKKFIRDYWEHILALLLFVFIVFTMVIAVQFSLNSNNKNVPKREPAWLEWEKAYGRQGF